MRFISKLLSEVLLELTAVRRVDAVSGRGGLVVVCGGCGIATRSRPLPEGGYFSDA
ncbi:MAG TPA: hypothetical protein VFN42_06490 [Acetobacteraceae bacterium]|nr:hypothetical protein [Acetobacteraceae bacterium]